jgi:hypothetical protein
MKVKKHISILPNNRMQFHEFCFVFVMLRSPKPHEASCYALGIFGKLWMSRGALTWFENVWSYSVEAIDYV